MEKQVYFNINGKELIIDKILVEFNEDLVFFVCRNNDIYYLALCIDAEEGTYLIALSSLITISKMLHGEMTMREAILNTVFYWSITLGNDPSKDEVRMVAFDQIPMECLPYEGENIILATKDLIGYSQYVDSLLYKGFDMTLRYSSGDDADEKQYVNIEYESNINHYEWYFNIISKMIRTRLSNTTKDDVIDINYDNVLEIKKMSITSDEISNNSFIGDIILHAA